MRRLSIIMSVLLLLVAAPVSSIPSQEFPPSRLGDPPVAALIHISPPNLQGVVTISGDPGAVPPSAEVAIQNLYTGESVYAYSSAGGTFLIDIAAAGSTPFWVSPVANVLGSERNRPGAPPGGPGTIITGPPAEPTVPYLPITQIQLDGKLDDWNDYVSARVSIETVALRNVNSFYLGTYMTVPDTAQQVIVFSIDAITYEFAFTPSLPQAAILRQIAPETLELGTRAVYSAVNEDVIEVRFPLDGLPIDQPPVLQRLFTRPNQNSDLQNDLRMVEALVPVYDEQDGRVDCLQSGTRFTVSGPIAQGTSSWQADGTIDKLQVEPGETITIAMDVTLHVPELGTSVTGLDLVGEVGLYPINSGGHVAMRPYVEGVSAIVPAAQTVRRGENLLACLQFLIPVPADFEPGRYVPLFRGRATIGDGELFDWIDNGIFGVGSGSAGLAETRLPIVINAGDVADAPLDWVLFANTSSDGTRGLQPEGSDSVGLPNLVRFNSERTILLPGAYPIEPYLLKMMSNDNMVTIAPLLPLQFPNGTLQATITRPDGTVDALPELPIVQNRLDRDEALFTEQASQNIYRLTTLDLIYGAYVFDQYGDYTVQLTGNIHDLFGNRYSGGGTYPVTIAESLDLTPGLLCGTPFQVGDALFTGGRVSPAVPADVTVNLRFYPINEDGVLDESSFSATANSGGYFIMDDGVVFDRPGEYIVDYNAQYRGADGRLWAASQRCAGVVANKAQLTLVAHGQRGLPTLAAYPDVYRPAWFNMTQYPPPEMNLGVPSRLFYPYFSGDIAVVPDGAESGIQPALTVQDLAGDYAGYLREIMPEIASLTDRALVDELPVLGRVYFSAVRPDVSVRQFVVDNNTIGVTGNYWRNDDPLNRQIGAGVDGLRPGDFVFLFGGAVVAMDATTEDAAAYAALAIITDAATVAGVYPAYSTAIVGDATMFVHLTSSKPGQVLTVGDTLSIVGQVAPTLPAQVTAIITSPNGTQRQFIVLTSLTGYFYNPANDFMVDEVGVWTVQLQMMPTSKPATGEIESPLPVGGIPGAVDGVFTITVLPADSLPLDVIQPDGTTTNGPISRPVTPGLPVNLSLLLPADWTSVNATTVVRTESTVLETSNAPVGDGVGVFSYSYNPSLISQRFPHLESDGTGDVVTLTVTLTGIDASGQSAVRARTFTLLNGRLESEQ